MSKDVERSSAEEYFVRNGTEERPILRVDDAGVDRLGKEGVGTCTYDGWKRTISISEDAVAPLRLRQVG
jgi:hypothetical protein